MFASSYGSRFALAAGALILVGFPGVGEAQLAGSEVHIGIGGPLTTGSATFGVEMRQAVDLAVAENNAAGGILGGKIVAVAIDDEAKEDKGKLVAKQFCDDAANLGVVGHVNSGVTIAASRVYGDCGLAVQDLRFRTCSSRHIGLFARIVAGGR